MSRTARNKLTIESLDEDRFRLFGHINGKKIRRWSTNLPELEALKLKLETEHEAEKFTVKKAMNVQQTRLTEDQVKDAEAAFRILPPGRSLFECVQAAESVLGNGASVSCKHALAEWLAAQRSRRLEESTIRENETHILRFLDASKTIDLLDATPRVVAKYVLRPDVADYTRLSYARVLYAWFNFCVREKFIKRNPVEVDISELKQRARPKKLPEILAPEQAKALLVQAVLTQKPGLVLFVILSTWGFMRRSEAERIKREQVIIRGDEIKIVLRGKKIGSKWREVSIPANVAALAIECVNRGAIGEPRPKLKNGVLIPNPNGQTLKFTDWDFKHLRARAGLLELQQSKIRADRVVIKSSDWAPNVLRHTGMSYLFQETGNIELVTQRAGNSEDVAYTHYLRRAEPEAFKDFNAISAAFPIAQENAQAVA